MSDYRNRVEKYLMNTTQRGPAIRTVFLIILASLTLGLLHGCQTSEKAIASERNAGDARIASGQAEARMFVKGLSCPLCAHNLDRELLRIPGMREVSVDLGTGEVRMIFNPNTPPTRRELVRAVEQSGFTFDRIEGTLP